MTALLLIGLASAFLIVLAVAGWIADGNAEVVPWDPGDWTPDYKTHPCGERGCRVDHDAVRPWRERSR